MKGRVLSHFSYYLLVWMFYDGALNHGISLVDERALRNVYENYENVFGLSWNNLNRY